MSSNASSDNTKMSTAAKTSKKSATKPAEVAAPVVAAAPAKATKAKKEVAAPAPVAAPVADATPAVAPVAAAEEDVSATLLKSLSDLSEQLASLKTAFAAASAAVKTIEKQAARVIKKADRKRRRKTAEPGAEAKPCIFTKPVRITDELCAFLGKPKGSEVSRSAVTKGVMAYAHAHSLMDKQTIKADAALRKLLTLGEGDALTILNLQKFLRRHYVKPTPAAV